MRKVNKVKPVSKATRAKLAHKEFKAQLAQLVTRVIKATKAKLVRKAFKA